MRVNGEYLIFLGGGTQFIHGALYYIDFIRQVRDLVMIYYLESTKGVEEK